jgi:hypothetical protein
MDEISSHWKLIHIKCKDQVPNPNNGVRRNFSISTDLTEICGFSQKQKLRFVDTNILPVALN